MEPPEESSLWKETERLRRRLDFLDSSHAEAIASLRREISSLESRLEDRVAEAAVKVPPVELSPPPLPRPEGQRPRPAPIVIAPVQRTAMAEPVPDEPVQEMPPAETPSFELDFGKVWFVRIGIVILLTGLVFLGNHAYQNWIREMPNGVRLTALFALAAALMEGGRRIAGKENLSRFGEVLIAGGMAFFYYCTFAAHSVARLKVIDSPVIGALLLSGAAGAIALVSWKRQARATATLGFVLAAYATMLQPIGWMSCASNVVLGAMGLFFMLKPGWSGPGWASMLGSYLAFFGWQLLGASGAETRVDDPATLWFLPPLWVMFSFPGVAGAFRESLSDRARAWFTGANNALFFLLFSAIWIQQNGDPGYWKVAAVFGPILIALGILGRRQDTTAGGVNLSQGLAVATFALVLKLEGQHLALTLAFESLALALAAWKYRGKSETAFSLAAGMGAGALAVANALHIQIWSAFLIASLLAAASVVTVRSNFSGGAFARFIRLSALLLFLAATVVISHLCLFRLETPTALLTAIALSGILSFAPLKLDPERLQPEVVWVSLWFLILGGWLGVLGIPAPVLWVAAMISLAACWLWHMQKEEKAAGSTPDPFRHPAIPAWAFSLAVPFFTAAALRKDGGAFFQTLVSNECAALVIAVLAIALRCKRLLVTSSAMALATLIYSGIVGSGGAAGLFITAFVALLPALAMQLPWSRERMDGIHPTAASVVFRATAFIAYCTAWHRFAPESQSDWLALTSIALTLGCLFLKREFLAESVGLTAVALLAFFRSTLTSAWDFDPGNASWRGITVVASLLLMVPTYRHRLGGAPGNGRDRVIPPLAALTCLVTTIWATQMLVWRFGWKPAAVLWTILGFAFVSAGLWQRLHALRICGFILLLVSFGKLFAADVWDFNTFMRVLSFIVLGAALILLGLFYNKFSGVIKSLLEDSGENLK